jgi:hypothetical protein
MNKETKTLLQIVALLIVGILLSRSWSAEEREFIYDRTEQGRYK